MKKFRMDTHMHFDLYNNHNEVLDYIEDNNSYTIAVTNLPDLFERYSHLCGKRRFVQIALGFHPELACHYSNQILKFDRYVSATRYIGEVGLDFTAKDWTNRNIQDQIFSHIVHTCNEVGGKVLTVHSRRAEKRVMEILENLSSCGVILHWYSGSMALMDEALKRGYYFSINHQMLQSANGRKIVDSIPIERILMESDAPFTKGLDKNYTIEFMEPIYKYICDARGLSEEEMSVILRNNFRTLLSQL